MKKTPLLEPKERVNIFFKSKLTRDDTDTELPFKLLVIGDFTNSEGLDTFTDREAISVTKDNFNSIMKGMEIKINMMADNIMGPESQPRIPVSLELSSLKDFEPDQIMGKVPQLKKLADLSRSLSETRRLLKNRLGLLESIKNIKLDPKTSP
ncbi:MAG: type VI secretion system contractile sheath small subunit [Deltaproteobacteria bacterium]|jgi:type VI secretion system protein ImpB|nr:type VI secretion system contractile sheath small subunit [Deltaproteobacteria bacterium]